MQPVIYRSFVHNMTIAFLLRRELRQMYKCKYEFSFIKNLPTQWRETEMEN